jgi:prolipoprotein diacylglyceryl transferase
MKIFQSIPSPTISYFDLGPLRVHFYALFILVGIAFAVWLGNRRFKSRGGNAGAILDIALWAVPFGIVGGRFYHVITHSDFYFHQGADLSKVFAVWEGGLAIYGALFFGTLGAILGARTAGIRFLSFADAIAPGVIVAQAIGRLGNYFNNELFGQPTDLPWGLEIPSSNDAYPAGLPSGVLFHPTFLYEIVWNLIGFAVLLLIDKRYNLRWGRLFGSYLVIYSTGRSFIESIRIDPSDYYFGIRTNVWSAIFGILAGLALIWWSRRTHTGLETSVYLAGREPQVEPQSKANERQDEKSDALDSESTKASRSDSKS